MDSPAGSVGEARTAAAIRALRDARAGGDWSRQAEIALDLPSMIGFGTHPGLVPALIHEVYAVVAEPGMRCRLAAALARAWVYGGDPSRARSFAAEAVRGAETLADLEILADALDAALLAHWSPRDFTERIRLAGRLADTTAHLSAVEPRLSALLWHLTTAWECLDVLAALRQLRALDLLAAESDSTRVAFFAASRRAMYALVADDLDSADKLIARTRDLGAATTEPDVDAVLHSLTSARARRADDTRAMRAEAAAFEEYGTAHGIASVVAESAVLWLRAVEPERASRLLHRLAGPGLDSIPEDVDYLLTLSCMVEVAAGTGDHDLARDGAARLEPYAGRAILNAGAVAFHGVVDDYLYRAHRAAGYDEARRWKDNAALAYRRVGAMWLYDRLTDAADRQTPAEPAVVTIHLHQNPDGTWTVGRDTTTTGLPDLRGLHYLHHLLSRPGTEVTAGDLSAAGHGRLAPSYSPGSDLLDRQALAAYRRRLTDVDTALAEADGRADARRSAQLTEEREFLLREIRAATGLGGRPRRFASTHERARVAVRKAITAALQRIDDHDPALARLLRDTVHTGAACHYDPDPARPVHWQLGPTGNNAPADR